MKDITLAIDGMSCGHCLNAVNKAISSVPGVEIKTVRLGHAELRVPEGDAISDQVKAAIEEAGYKVNRLLAG
jgi:copper chaperone